MDEPPSGRPFPPLLFWALVLPAAMFVVGSIEVIRVPRGLSPIALAMFVIPMAMGLVAVPIAIILLRRGYRTTRNVLLTLAGAIPVVVLFVMWLYYNLTHFHI